MSRLNTLTAKTQLSKTGNVAVAALLCLHLQVMFALRCLPACVCVWESPQQWVVVFVPVLPHLARSI